MKDATDNGPRWAIIGRGLAGWHAAGADGRTSSSGGELLSIRRARSGELLPGYAAEALDGAPIYDAADADFVAFHAFVMHGPMVGASLPPGTWDRWTVGVVHAPATCPALGSSWCSGVALDRVAPDVYIRWLRAAVPGVRFGVVRDGAPVWEGGEL